MRPVLVQPLTPLLHSPCQDALTRRTSAYLPTHYLSWATLPTPTVVKNTEDKASTSDFFSLFSYIFFLSSPFLHLTSTYSFLPFFLSFEVDEGENKSQETMRTIV